MPEDKVTEQPGAGPNTSRRLEITLLEELSSGTFARVYLAEARAAGGIDRIIAVKVLRQKWSESEDILARTRDEARLLARLRHKNIVRVEELIELEGQPAIIMEFVEGMDLKELVETIRASGQRFPPRAALQIAADTASALNAAYNRIPYGLDEPLRVVHRDIKPSNIMVSVDGELKVLDFGTARSTSPFRAAKTGAVRFGSWKYMSPERKEGSRGEQASDIYSLGLVLIELFSDQWLPMLPIAPEEHDPQRLDIIRSLPDLGMPNQEWDQAMREILLQMTPADASARPTARQVLDVLRPYSDHARGVSLETLAGKVVYKNALGNRRSSPEGALSGTRLYVSFDSSGPSSVAPGHPSTSPAPRAGSSVGDDGGDYDGDDDGDTTVTSTAPHPGAAGYSGLSAPGATAAPTAPTAPFPPAGQAGPESPPAGAAQLQPIPLASDHPSPTNDPPTPPQVPATAIPIDSPPLPSPAAPPPNREKATPGWAKLLLAGTVLAGLLVSLAFVGWLLFAGMGRTLSTGLQQGVLQTEGQRADAALSAPSSAASPDGEPVEAPGGEDNTEPADTVAEGPPQSGSTKAEKALANVYLELADPTIQWVRLSNDQLGVSHKIRGTFQQDLPSATYQISAKVAGRSRVDGQVNVGPEGIALSCTPQPGGKVNCTDKTGGHSLTLGP